MKVSESEKYGGYVTDGFIQDEAEAQRMATIQGDISKTWKVGDIRYKDLDGVEGITSAKTIYNTGDQKVIGNTTPRYSFNINASASWKGFDVRVFFEGIAKRDLWIDSPVFWDFRVIATYGNLLLMITMLIILGVRIIPMPITRFQVIVAGVSKPKQNTCRMVHIFV